MPVDANQMTQYDVLRRWPRLVAHMICESLGYFTPKAAANAILSYKLGQPFYCEWYFDTALKRGAKTEEELEREILKIGKEVIIQAFRNRHLHEGPMSDYKLALRIVEKSLKGIDPLLASWF